MASLRGVVAKKVVYTGGSVEAAPTYESVCTGDGHSEAIRVTFDKALLSYGELLDGFWAGHEPRWPVHSKARSAIWFHDDSQRAAAVAALAAREVALGRRVHTAVLPLGAWYEADGWQQQYLAKQLARRGER